MSKFVNVYTVKGRSQTLYRSCCTVDKEQEEVSQRSENLVGGNIVCEVGSFRGDGLLC